MVNCPDCKYWMAHDDGEYGVCTNDKHVNHLIHDMKIAYYRDEESLHRLHLIKYYEPLVTDKYYRCMDGESDRD